MTHLRQRYHLFTMLLLGAVLLTSAPRLLAQEQAEKIKVAIFTGQNNHAWMVDSPALQRILDDAQLFETTILQTPDRNAEDKSAKWDAFDPDLKAFDVIVFNYNGEMWPEKLKAAWLAYVRDGGRVFSFHAGNNPFKGWEEFEKMIGLLWRNNNNEGKRLYLDDAGKPISQQAGEGLPASHGRQHEFVIQHRKTDHPIFKGLPNEWLHGRDELYHGQRGPAENMTVLMSAYSDPKTGGTGVHEPIAWTIPYGKGIVLTNVLGHWAGGEDGAALQCVGFQTIFTRSIEWLATDNVTLEKPENFPSKDKVSTKKFKPFEPLSYLYIEGQPGSDPMVRCSCGQYHDIMQHADALLAEGATTSRLGADDTNQP